MSGTRALNVLASLGIAAALGLTAPLPAAGQGIPAKARRVTVTANTPRMLVANPSTSSPADEPASVAIGTGARKRMDKIAGNDYQVITDSLMNEALKQYDFPPNAILSPALNVQLAKNIPNTRVVVTSTMTRAGNEHAVTARLVGTTDEAGYVVTLAQQPNQPLPDFGAKVAEALEPGVKALGDARECMSQLEQKKFDKATDAANKALKTAPNDGLAHYCLAQIAREQHRPVGEIVQQLQEATKGDNLSLAAYSQLADIYQAQNDTAKTVAIFSDLLRVAPTNQKLRENIFKYLLQAGKPDVAKAVADSGLRLDPANADLLDLKSNACAFLSDFKCAMDAINQRWQLDSARSGTDTLFLAKAVAFSEQRLADTNPKPTKQDSLDYISWVRRSAAKSPNNPQVLAGLIRAYGMAGQPDSALAVTRKLMALDSTNVVPALAAVQSLAAAKQLDSTHAGEFISFVQRHGDATAKDQLAAILLSASSPYLQQETHDWAKAVSLLKQSVALADPKGKVATPANFYLGFADFQLAAEMDAQTEKQKSCDLAKQEAALLGDSRTALNNGKAQNAETAAKLLGYLDQFDKRVASMQKVYCK
jgi:Flp pilus assembly protein TadD